MNRTININISGIVFYIDEAAYEKLQNYLATVKGYFKNTEGGDEIMSDIESRIAEMFQQKVGATKQALSMKDVDDVMEIMGKPESFATEDAQHSQATTANNNKQQEHATKIANGPKRLYRDPDDKIIGGVCSGVAQYFGMDPVWIRLALALAFFIGGTGFLLYVLLWIIIPKASTTAEKLQMKGERIDISSIERTIKEELNDVKNRVEKGGVWNEIVNFIQKALSLIGYILTRIFKAIAKIFSGFVIFIGVILLIILVGFVFKDWDTLTITADNGENMLPLLKDFIAGLFGSTANLWQAKIGIFLVVGLPLIMLVYGAARYILKIKQHNKWVSRSAAIAWLIGIVLVIISFSNVAKEFKYKANDKIIVPIACNSNILTIDAIKDTLKYGEETDDDDIDFFIGGWEASGDNAFVRKFRTELNIIKTNTDSCYLIIRKSTRGRNKKDAAQKLTAISYGIQSNDSAVIVDKYFSIGDKSTWRNQQVKVTLCIPVGKTIYLSKKLKNVIYDIENTTNTFDDDMLERRWIMTNKGLTCVDCDGIKSIDKDEVEINDAIEEGDDVVLDIDKNGVKINGKSVNDKSEKDHDVNIDAKSVDLKIDEHGVRARLKGKAKEKTDKE